MSPILHCQILGESPQTVVLLHGLFGVASNLGPLARELARDYRVLLPDLRNHGRSFHAPEMDYALIAADVASLLDKLGIDRAALVGHSMGGKVAMQFALDRPQRTQALVVGDIAPVDYTPHHHSVFAALREVAEDPLADRRATQRILERHIDEPGVVGLMLMNRVQVESRWQWRFDLDAIERNYAAILAAPASSVPYRGPVLFIKGENSRYITGECAAATAELFPRARLKVIAGAGHWLHAEKPMIFLRLVRSFLGESLAVAAPGA
jgi:esterase